jgi:hypothetical protein
MLRALLWLLGVRRKPKVPPIDYDITWHPLPFRWPVVEVERPWWCGAMEVHATMLTDEGVTEYAGRLNAGTRCTQCGGELTERKVLARMAVNPADATWEHVLCPAGVNQSGRLLDK